LNKWLIPKASTETLFFSIQDKRFGETTVKAENKTMMPKHDPASAAIVVKIYQDSPEACSWQIG
jgi:hypothetical protein